MEILARWQSGDAAACKAAYTGSIPVRASNQFRLRNMKTKTALIALSAICLTTGVSAHHGSVTNGSLYRAEELIQLEGEITEVFWQNPHVRGKMKIENDSRNEEIWEVEFAGGPRNWERRGMVADDFLGSVKVAGYVSRRNSQGLGVVHMLFPSGQEFVTGGASPIYSSELVPDSLRRPTTDQIAKAEQAADGIFRVWGGSHPEPEEELLRVREFFTERGRELSASYDPLKDNLELVCRQGMPDVNFEPVPMDITDQGGRIRIRSEEYNMERYIYLDALPAQPEPSPTGYSVGHWEGATLVVETTGIDWPFYSEIGIPQSDQVRYLERFWLSEDGNNLNYSIEVTDPIIFTEPLMLIERSRPWTPGVELGRPYNCIYEWQGFND